MKTLSIPNLSLPDNPQQALPAENVTRSNSTATEPARPSLLYHVLTVAMLACFALGGWLLAGNPNSHASSSAGPMGNLSNSTTTPGNQQALSTTSIEEIRLGQRVVGRNPLRHETQSPTSITPEHWRAIHLTMQAHGVQYDLAFLRSLDWLEATGAEPGGEIHLHLPEMGLDGPALVESINSCPPIEPADGPRHSESPRMLVTGTIRHLASNILEVAITGLDGPLGVTDTHPLWSETRQDFVVAGQLQVGEHLRSETGVISQVTSITPHRGAPESTYNLEIDGEHVYEVGTSGILSHNSCPGGLGNIGSHDPMDAGKALDRAEDWLGPGYREIAAGVFRSSDDLRQFRMTSWDLMGTHSGGVPHVHFEAINPNNSRDIIENLHIFITE